MRSGATEVNETQKRATGKKSLRTTDIDHGHSFSHALNVESKIKTHF
jgi:hypothetical protein